jgi:hypothetical protein
MSTFEHRCIHCTHAFKLNPISVLVEDNEPRTFHRWWFACPACQHVQARTVDDGWMNLSMLLAGAQPVSSTCEAMDILDVGRRPLRAVG